MVFADATETEVVVLKVVAVAGTDPDHVIQLPVELPAAGDIDTEVEPEGVEIEVDTLEVVEVLEDELEDVVPEFEHEEPATTENWVESRRYVSCGLMKAGAWMAQGPERRIYDMV